jgi:hypothetical protein
VPRFFTAACSAFVLLLVVAPAAVAHGVQGKAQTPIPISAFFWAAGAVLIVSFVALGFGWSNARFAKDRWRPAPRWLDRFARSPVTVWTARVIVLLCFLFLFAAAAFGSTRLNANIAPVTIFVTWWVGLVPLSVLFGNVWRAVSPWNTLARLVRLPETRERKTPRWLGIWPAAVFLTAFAWFELVYPTAADPRLIAALITVYTVVTLAGMYVYGRERWLDHGEVFSVYTGTLARLSPVEIRDGRLGLRPPLVGVTRISWQPAQIAFIGVLIGTVTFDGLSGSEFWSTRDVAAAERLIDLGVSSFTAGILVATIGLLLTLGLVIGAYELAAFISGRTAGWARVRQGGRNAIAFAHSLIPIALAYFVAHYFTLFVFQSQDIIRLASDPFGQGSDLFGTADHKINFTLVSANAIWAVQVASIVLGHVAGLVLAHDRALELAGNHRLALRSQYPMLVLMVLLTVAGLWSLSQGMATA